MLLVTARINWKTRAGSAGSSAAHPYGVAGLPPPLASPISRDQKMESSALAVVQEVLGAARVVKAFGQEDREEARFMDRSNQGMAGRVRLAFIEGKFSLLVTTITALGTGTVLYIGVHDIQAGP